MENPSAGCFSFPVSGMLAWESAYFFLAVENGGHHPMGVAEVYVSKSGYLPL
jgi:hypothetical protein